MAVRARSTSLQFGSVDDRLGSNLLAQSDWVLLPGQRLAVDFEKRIDLRNPVVADEGDVPPVNLRIVSRGLVAAKVSFRAAGTPREWPEWWKAVARCD